MLATMTEPTTYNGWTNHATWVVGLHLMDDIVEIVLDDIDYWKKDELTEAAQLFKDHVEDLIDESELNPFIQDLLDTSSINYRELGQAMLNRVFP
jgi:hypothetical protein